MSELKTKTIKAAKWTTIETFSVRMIQFVLGIIVARLLTPADYGLIGMLSIFTAICQTFIDSGMTMALLRKKDTSPEDFNTVFVFNFIVSVLAYGILFFCAPLIANFYNQPILCLIVRVMCITLVIGACGSIINCHFAFILDFKQTAKISVISSLASGVCALICAYFGFGVWALVAQQVLYGILTTSLLWILSPWHPSFVFVKESFKRLFGYSSKLLASNLINAVYFNLSSVLIGKFFSPSSLGFYTRGRQMPGMITDTVNGIVNKISFPVLGKIQDDDNALLAANSKFIRLSSMIFSIVLINIAILAKPIILFLLTEEWEKATIFIQIFCGILLFDHVNQLNLVLLQIKGRSDLALKLEIIKRIISFGFLFGAIPFGVIALAISQLIYSQIALFLNCLCINKILGKGYIKQWKEIGPYLLYGLIASIPSVIFMLIDTFDIVKIICGFSLSLILYLLLLKYNKDSIYREYIEPIFVKFSSRISFLNQK